MIAEAQEVMQGGAPRVVAFGVSDETAWTAGLACGGKIEVYVEAVDAALAAVIDELRVARAAHRAVALLTRLDGGGHRIAGAAATPAVAEALRTERAIVDDGVLIEPHNPPLRLILVGAVHVAEPLARMAELAGFAVTLVDPRRAWATSQRFPEQTFVVEWPDVALDKLAPDARTAIVTLTHDPKLDDPALIAALATPAFYIGCLGSAKTHAARLERLAGRGDLARLHGPVGLPIHARSPAEIAVSILAEIVATLRGGDR